jgi:hypothetical protein
LVSGHPGDERWRFGVNRLRLGRCPGGSGPDDGGASRDAGDGHGREIAWLRWAAIRIQTYGDAQNGRRMTKKRRDRVWAYANNQFGAIAPTVAKLDERVNLPV